jgi:hypothetical protein
MQTHTSHLCSTHHYTSRHSITNTILVRKDRQHAFTTYSYLLDTSQTHTQLRPNNPKEPGRREHKTTQQTTHTHHTAPILQHTNILVAPSRHEGRSHVKPLTAPSRTSFSKPHCQETWTWGPATAHLQLLL